MCATRDMASSIVSSSPSTQPLPPDESRGRRPSCGAWKRPSVGEESPARPLDDAPRTTPGRRPSRWRWSVDDLPRCSCRGRGPGGGRRPLWSKYLAHSRTCRKSDSRGRTTPKAAMGARIRAAPTRSTATWTPAAIGVRFRSRSRRQSADGRNSHVRRMPLTVGSGWGPGCVMRRAREIPASLRAGATRLCGPA